MIRLYALKEGSQHKFLNIISGLKEGKLIAPFSFEGSCDSSVFNVYVEKVLQPFMNKKTLFILDNASFHKASKIEKIAKKNNSEVLYLLTYSHDLRCVAGKFFSLGASSCLSCSAGTYADIEGLSACIDAVAGQCTANSTGAAACIGTGPSQT